VVQSARGLPVPVGLRSRIGRSSRRHVGTRARNTSVREPTWAKCEEGGPRCQRQLVHAACGGPAGAGRWPYARRAVSV
jgi:hypothetical protein